MTDMLAVLGAVGWAGLAVVLGVVVGALVGGAVARWWAGP
jgi:hypothetical protein